MAKHSPALDDTFRALADPTRRAVVQALTRGPASVSALAEPFDMALPSFVQHIRQLEACGLITSRKEGRVRTCALNAARLGEAERWMAEQRRLWEAQADRLGGFLKTKMQKKKDA